MGENTETIQAAFDAIGEILHKNGIENAVVIIDPPGGSEADSRLFLRGSFYEGAKLVAAASRMIKRRMNEDLQGL